MWTGGGWVRGGTGRRPFSQALKPGSLVSRGIFLVAGWGLKLKGSAKGVVEGIFRRLHRRPSWTVDSVTNVSRGPVS